EGLLCGLLTVEDTVDGVRPGLAHLRTCRVRRYREGGVLDLQDHIDPVVEGFVATVLDKLTEDAFVGCKVTGVGARVRAALLGTDAGALGSRGEPSVRARHGGHPGARRVGVGRTRRDRPSRAGR